MREKLLLDIIYWEWEEKFKFENLNKKIGNRKFKIKNWNLIVDIQKFRLRNS